MRRAAARLAGAGAAAAAAGLLAAPAAAAAGPAAARQAAVGVTRGAACAWAAAARLQQLSSWSLAAAAHQGQRRQHQQPWPVSLARQAAPVQAQLLPPAAAAAAAAAAAPLQWQAARGLLGVKVVKNYQDHNTARPKKYKIKTPSAVKRRVLVGEDGTMWRMQAGRRHKRYKKSRGRLAALRGMVPLHRAASAKLRKLGYKRSCPRHSRSGSRTMAPTFDEPIVAVQELVAAMVGLKCTSKQSGVYFKELAAHLSELLPTLRAELATLAEAAAFGEQPRPSQVKALHEFASALAAITSALGGTSSLGQAGGGGGSLSGSGGARPVASSKRPVLPPGVSTLNPDSYFHAREGLVLALAQHVAGVEALAVSADSRSLYTASRDSIVKRWDVGGGRPVCSASFEGHIDWVNDVLLFGERLVSCSSDRTVKVWATGDEARCLHTVQHHSDYVTCLAGSEAAGKVVSGGLRSEVITYDMETMTAHLIMPHTSGGAPGAPGGEPPASAAAPGDADAAAAAAAGVGGQAAGPPTRSVYALAMNRSGGLVAGGTTEGAIRLVDPRSGAKVMKLKGHTDNVRALLLNEDGTLLLSGSSDHTVRLWDLGQQRCVQTLAVHTDSVWALAASPDLSLVYSGGRDRAVYATHMGRRQAYLLAREAQPVRSMALSEGGTRLWVSTTLSSVNAYDLPHDYCGPAAQQHLTERARRAAAGAQQHAAQQGLGPQQGPGQQEQQEQQQQQQQQQQHEGGPPQGQQQQSQQSQQPGGQTQRGGAAGNGLPQGQGPGGALRGATSPPAAGRSLSGVGGRALMYGSSPSVRLRQSMDPGAGEEAPLLSPAVTIAGSPGLVALRVLSDKRHVLTRDSDGLVQLWDVDIAEVERRLFRPLYVESWFTPDVKLGALALTLEPPRCFAAEAYALDLGLRDVPDDQKVNLGAALLRNALAGWGRAFSRLYLSGAPLPGLDDPCAEGLPRFSDDAPPAVVSTSASGVAWRISAGAFTGREREGEDLPGWVAEAVLRGLLPYVKELKAAFALQPAPDSGLPSLLQGRLNAPRILQVMKVANYCATRLAEQGVSLATHAVGETPESQAPPDDGQQYLELTCNGLAVPYTMSIATVKKFIWKRSDDVLFVFRVADRDRLAPFPALGPRGGGGAAAPGGGAGARAGGSDACVICYAKFEHGEQLKLLPCLHMYHVACIDAWLQRDRSCPVCTADVVRAACLCLREDWSAHTVDAVAESSGSALRPPPLAAVAAAAAAEPGSVLAPPTPGGAAAPPRGGPFAPAPPAARGAVASAAAPLAPALAAPAHVALAMPPVGARGGAAAAAQQLARHSCPTGV
ncbi:wdr48 [Scenedesmus sp. PABB004]|nr:wdr48 [Scenedesmus sp. PABB004]